MRLILGLLLLCSMAPAQGARIFIVIEPTTLRLTIEPFVATFACHTRRNMSACDNSGWRAARCHLLSLGGRKLLRNW
jgi:hypothetical protein